MFDRLTEDVWASTTLRQAHFTNYYESYTNI